MPSGPFAHVCLLVRNLDEAVDHWTKILSVLDPKQLEKRVVRYDGFEGGEDRMRWATFVSDHGAEIQLMEPAPNTPLGRRLEKYGEGVHHIALTTNDVEGSLAALKEKGIDSVGEISGDPEMSWQKWGWISPKHAHGVLVEVAKPYKSKGDGKWYPAEE
ncbi:MULTISPECIES: VOC family protein [unclassified Chelatococcus]|uniref:VOC family protein n=1 Tax=unclassified Chelatococcus TaxID=2638111 RepID=UPI001BCBC6E0|nr:MULTISPECIES: VOC family protein [unclassified Chelatococcus]MBS7743439.1 VOC family protein [Chelatococcus sp. HY11]MBX3547184.1 VOC family protein [Chelatococcus sp.]CAH1663824.1 Methylmalonyl-CoA/ethylmalonyl-CoA epimerase [Hyphomicrobiales bacterium]CAH1687921.1 Methylmalonyl-CoA/ethylmalonyl-CoA epimerase [Hyphomicrobiales bacterium]